jgi:ABC-type sugar transport system, permease component
MTSRHERAEMNPRIAKALVNGGLIGISAIVLMPMLWMLSVSFMQPGEASTYPPPLLPAHATWTNYHELFERAGMGRYLANSLPSRPRSRCCRSRSISAPATPSRNCASPDATACSRPCSARC